MKVYVKDFKKKNVDGDKLQVVKTYESKPKWFTYIIFNKK